VLPVLVFCLSAAMTVATWQWRSSDERLRGQLRFEAEAEAIRTGIGDRLKLYEQLLRAGEGLLAHGPVGRREWRRFAGALGPGRQLPGIVAFAVVYPVSDQDRAGFEAGLRAETPDFAIFPGGSRPDYLVNAFVEPEDSAGRAVGFDAGESPERRAALESSRDSGETMLTGRLPMLVPATAGTGFLLYRPVYRNGERPATVELRRAGLTAWIAVAFGVPGLMQDIAARHPGIDIDLFEGGAPDKAARIYDSLGSEVGPLGDERPSLYRRESRLELGGRSWLVALDSTRAFEASAVSIGPTVVLFAGLALSTLLGLVVYLLQRGRERAVALAGDMTAALAASEARYRTIIDHAGFGIIIADGDGRLVQANPAFARMLGMALEGLAGRPWIDFTHPDDRARCQVPAADLLAGRVDRYQQEQRFLAADGATVWGSLAATRIPGSDGRPAQTVAMIEDITARKAADLSLRQLWRAVEHAPISVVITTETGAIEYANPAAEQITGYSEREMIGRNPRLFQSGHTPHAVYERMWSTIGSGEVWRGELLNRRKNGDLFWESMSIAPVRDEDGRISHFVGLKQDITARRRAQEALRASERRFRQMFEGNKAVELLVDPESGRLIDANAAAARFYGYPREALRTMTIFQINTLLPGDVLAEMALARAEQRDTFYFRHRLASGELRDVEVHAGPLEVDGRTLLYSIIHDVTARKKAETELVRAREEAEQANRAKSQFLATMSHELRIPLNTILGFSEIIRDELMGPEALPRYAEYAGDIHDGGVHLLNLINDILDIAKIEAGKLEIERVPLPLPALLQSAARLVSVRALEARLTLTVQCPDALPPLLADERGIKQILFNLLSNAIKFTPAGGWITLGADVDAEGATRLTVTDTGIGIPPDQLERVIRPFEQVDNRYGRSAGGTGLGLALVKALTELHGGRLAIASTVGEGTTVTVTLPAPAAAVTS